MTDEGTGSAAPRSLRETAAKGTLLIVVLKVTGTAIGRISQLILPFYLLPSDFGIFALASFFFGFLTLASDLGMSTDLIRRRGDFEEAARTAFGLRLVLAVGGIVGSLGVGLGAAFLFAEPRVTLPIVVLSIGLLFQATSMVPRAIALRRLDYRRGAVPDHIGKFTGSLATIGLAIVGLAYWSPVYGTVLGLGLGASLQIASSRWRPRAGLRADLARDILRFGQFVTLTSFANFVAHSIDAAFVGLFLGVTALGIYAFAYSWGVYFVSNLSSVFGAVAYPLFAHIADAPARLRRAYLGNLRYYAYAAAPVGAGIVVLAPLFVETIYDATWLAAVVPMQILAVVGLLLGFAGIAGDALYALGRSRRVFLLSAAEAVLLVVLFPVATTRFGLVGTSLAAAAGAAFLAGALSRSLCRELGIAWREWLRAIGAPCLAVVAMAPVAFALLPSVPRTPPHLALALGTFALVFVGLLQAITSGRFLSEFRRILVLATR
ncbi:MAG: oligosaccharide flippase family protein [Methanobacteriota archaeon]